MMLFNLYRQLARAPSFLRHLIINSFFYETIFFAAASFYVTTQEMKKMKMSVFLPGDDWLSLSLSFFF